MNRGNRKVVGRNVVLGGVLLLGLVAWTLVGGSGRGVEASLMDHVRALRAEAPPYVRWINASPRIKALLPTAWGRRVWMADSKRDMGRRSAVQRLGRMGTNAWPVLPELLKTVDGGSYPSGLAAGEALALIRAEKSPAWNGWKRSPEGRKRAARVFGYLMTGHNSFFGVSYDDRHRAFGLAGLATTGPAGAEWRVAMVEILEFEGDPAIRALAVLALAAMDPSTETLSRLGQLVDLESEWAEVRAAALLGMGQMAPGDGAVRERIRRALNDSKAHVRVAAVRALWEKGEPFMDEIQPTLDSLTRHRLVTIRVAALKLLEEMGRAGVPVRSEIERLAGDEDESVRREAAAVLLGIPSR